MITEIYCCNRTVRHGSKHLFPSITRPPSQAAFWSLCWVRNPFQHDDWRWENMFRQPEWFRRKDQRNLMHFWEWMSNVKLLTSTGLIPYHSHGAKMRFWAQCGICLDQQTGEEKNMAMKFNINPATQTTPPHNKNTSESSEQDACTPMLQHLIFSLSRAFQCCSISSLLIF